MTKQQRRASKKLIFLTDLRQLVQKHKAISFVALLLVLLACTIGVYNFAQYQQKFSKDDFERLASMVETVLKQSGNGKSIEIKKECSYERPGEFDDLHLYCSILAVSYLNYIDYGHTIVTSRSYQQNIQNVFGYIFASPPNLYTADRGEFETFYTILPKAFPKHSCNFYLDTKYNARQILTFPARKENNLMALSFECAAESRGEYYPVTYRQG